MNIYQLIQLDDRSATPKYLQLANALLRALEQGLIGPDYPLPSINELSFELDISRDTAEKSFRHLKQLGVIGSFPGKGYFIQQPGFRQKHSVLLLFNKLSAHKKIIYDAFAERLGNDASIDFYVYNNDFGLFKKLLQSRQGNYSDYVIIPHFLDSNEHAKALLDELPGGNLVLMDKLIPNLKRKFGAVFEPFEQDIYRALQEALPRLTRYRTLKIIFPAYTYFPEAILQGFRCFCQDYAFPHHVVSDVSTDALQEGDMYINLMEDDLVILLEKMQVSSLQPDKDIGIICYNETPWKRFILNGITTISTDFRKMGEMAAEMVLNGQQELREVPFTLTMRDSL